MPTATKPPTRPRPRRQQREAEPDTAGMINLSIYAPAELVHKIDAIATAERRSRRQQVLVILEDAFRRQPDPVGTAEHPT